MNDGKEVERLAEEVFSWIDQWDTENYPSKKSDCKDKIAEALLAHGKAMFEKGYQEGFTKGNEWGKL